MANLRLELLVTASTDKLSSALNSASGNIRTWGGNAQRTFSGVSSSVAGLYQKLNGFSAITKLAAAAGGYSIVTEALQRNLEFEKTLLDMKQTAEMTTSQAAEMRQLAIDAASKNLATPSEIASGLKAFSAAGMKFDQIKSSIDESARAAVAFRSTVEQIALLDFDLQDKMKLDPSQIVSAHNMLLYHAKSGRYEAAPMATEAPKYLNSVASVGIGGIKGLNFTGAMTQVLMKLAPATQPAEVATFMEHGLSHITSKQQVKGLQKFGINVKKYMPDGKFYGEGGVQGALDLAAEMKKKGLEDPFKLDKAGFREMYTKKFWKNLMRYHDEIQIAMTEGNKAALDDMVGRDNAEIMGSNYGKIKQLNITKEKGQVSEPAQQAVTKLADIEAWAAENPKTALAGAAAAAVGGRLLWKKMTGSGTGGGGGLIDKAMSAGKGAMPVTVTNWPNGLGAPAKASERMSNLKTVAGGAASGAGAAAAGTAVIAGVGASIVVGGAAAAVAAAKATQAKQKSLADMASTAFGGAVAGDYGFAASIMEAAEKGEEERAAALAKQKAAAPQSATSPANAAAATLAPPNPKVAAAKEKATHWQKEIEQLDKRINNAKAANEKDAVARLERQRGSDQKHLETIIIELRNLQKIADRPVQVNLDGRPLVDAVNKENGREARRN